VAEALQEFKRSEQTAQLGFGQSLEKAQLIVERVNGKLSEIPA